MAADVAAADVLPCQRPSVTLSCQIRQRTPFYPYLLLRKSSDVCSDVVAVVCLELLVPKPHEHWGSQAAIVYVPSHENEVPLVLVSALSFPVSIAHDCEWFVDLEAQHDHVCLCHRRCGPVRILPGMLLFLPSPSQEISNSPSESDIPEQRAREASDSWHLPSYRLGRDSSTKLHCSHEEIVHCALSCTR